MIPFQGAVVAVLGLSFKEDVPDLRNTRVVDIIRELTDDGVKVRVHDPLADPQEAQGYYGLELHRLEDIAGVDAVIVAVAYQPYRAAGLGGIARPCKPGKAMVVDAKSAFNPKEAAQLGITYWRLQAYGV
jgi:UDP-N-acetyl-D-glucosamine/UDP-N-acetyl-D-galactosamine dehydrogenase